MEVEVCCAEKLYLAEVQTGHDPKVDLCWEVEELGGRFIGIITIAL